MKYLSYLTIMVMWLFVSCDNAEDDIVGDIGYEKAYPAQLSFDADASSSTLTVLYNDVWKITGAQDWCRVTPASGIAPSSVMVSVTENNQNEKRFLWLTVECNNIVTEIFVTQNGRSASSDGSEQNVYEFIDLGLSVNWAKYNVGASAPEQYGDYFAWGETSPKSSYTINSSTSYKKDIGIITGTTSDAATVNWGKQWRMPTNLEISELVNKCEWEWTTLEGINGAKVIGPNGNYIFLPAGGYKIDTSTYGMGANGCYWSSTPDDMFDRMYSYDLGFQYFPILLTQWYGYSERWKGNNIRAVTEKE